MAVVDRKVHSSAVYARTSIRFIVESVPINQAAVLFGAVIPYQGFPVGEPSYAIYGWQVESVYGNQTSGVNTVQFNILIGAVSVQVSLAALLPGGVVALYGSSLVAPALRRGRFADQLNLQVTSNGTGVATGMSVTVTIRPYPLDGEA